MSLKFNSRRFHIVGWLIVFGVYLIAESGWAIFDTAFLFSDSLFLLANMATFYLGYFILSKVKPAHLFYAAIPAIIFSTFSFIPFRYLIQEQILKLFTGSGNYFNLEFSTFVSDNLWRGFIPAVASIIVFLLEREYGLRTAEKELREKHQEAEKAFLRSQLNPHFLFNTMSYLHSRAFAVDEELADTIQQFSEVLRYAVDGSLAKAVTIESEIKFIDQYISILRKRLEDRFNLSWTVGSHDEQSRLQEVEPLILVPFVENACKHGVLSDPENPVKIDLKINKNELLFTCINKIHSGSKDKTKGIGLENIRRRLEIRYPQTHTLEITENETTFSVVLKINKLV